MYYSIQNLAKHECFSHISKQHNVFKYQFLDIPSNISYFIRFGGRSFGHLTRN